MSGVRLLVLFSILLLFLIPVSEAIAAPGCDAPPDTAATEQYCETVAAPQGSTDVTQPASRPLAETLPPPVASRLRQAGILVDVLLAQPTGDALLAGMANSGGAARRRAAAARRAAFDPRLKALRPGPGVSPLSAINATTAAGAASFKLGFGWVLVFIMVFLAGFSVSTRNLGNRDGA